LYGVQTEDVKPKINGNPNPNSKPNPTGPTNSKDNRKTGGL